MVCLSGALGDWLSKRLRALCLPCGFLGAGCIGFPYMARLWALISICPLVDGFGSLSLSAFWRSTRGLQFDGFKVMAFHALFGAAGFHSSFWLLVGWPSDFKQMALLGFGVMDGFNSLGPVGGLPVAR